MKIAIISFSSYPEGTGADHYNLELGQGLIENGHEVECLAPAPCLSKTAGNLVEGIANGVRFRYTCGFAKCNWKGTGFFKKLRLFFYGIYTLYKYLYVQKKKDVPFKAFIVGADWPLIFALKPWGWWYHVPIIVQCFEYPVFLILDKRGFSRRVMFWAFHFYDGIVAISDALESYYKPLLPARCRSIVSPLLIPPSLPPQFPLEPGNYIAYCGDMDGMKDDIDLLLESFIRFSPKHPETTLKLFGKCSEGRSTRLKKKIISAKLEDRVEFCGFVASDTLKGALQSAALLVIPKSDNLQNCGNFPSKLGQYLSTGVPILASDVGSVSKYFRNNEDIYFVEPDNIEAFAKRLDDIFSHRDAAMEVGLRGRKVGEKLFSRNVQARRIGDFIAGMVAERKTVHAKSLSPSAKIAMLQPFCPHYRSDFLTALQNSPGMDIYCLFTPQEAEARGFHISGIRCSVIHRWYFKGPLFFNICPFLRRSYRIWILMADPMLGSNWILLLLAPLLGRKAILWGQGVKIAAYDRFFAKVPFWWKMMYKLSAGAWFYTECEERRWRQILPGLKSVALNNTIGGLSSAAPRSNLAERNAWKRKHNISTAFNFIYCARFNAQRRIDLLQEAIRRLPPDQYGFIIIGGGEDKPDFSEFPNVYDFGSVYDEALKRELFTVADVYFQPAWLGLSVVEAMSYGKPILTFERSESRLQGVEYGYIQDAGCGVIVRKMDEMIHLIQRMPVEEWQLLGEQGRAYLEARLLTDNMVENARKLLNELEGTSLHDR